MQLSPLAQSRSFLNSLIHIPMDSESTAKVIDQVDLSKFSPKKSFTPTNAAAMAALATMAYSTPEDQKAHLDKQKAVRSFHFLDSKDNESLGIDAPDTGTQVSVVETDKAVLVAARGTTPPWFAKDGAENEAQWQDYVSDIAVLPVSNYDDSARVHGGFKEAADGIWDQLKPYLEQARASHKVVHLAGHSLGAAIALLLADRMNEELGVLPQSVIRTGGPDIGWSGEKEHLEESGIAARTFNFVNNIDPIPLVLPKGSPVGTEIYFDRHGKANLKNGAHCWDRLLGSTTGILHGKLGPLYDHVPAFYNELITAPRNAEALQKIADQAS